MYWITTVAGSICLPSVVIARLPSIQTSQRLRDADQLNV